MKRSATPGASNSVGSAWPAYPAIWLNEVQASNDAKTFILGDLGTSTAPFSPTPATEVLRRAYTTTVQMKNFQP